MARQRSHNMMKCWVYDLMQYFFMQLQRLWTAHSTEVVVSLIQAGDKKDTIAIHHRELLSLRPHTWVYGEVITSESLCTNTCKGLS